MGSSGRLGRAEAMIGCRRRVPAPLDDGVDAVAGRRETHAPAPFLLRVAAMRPVFAPLSAAVLGFVVFVAAHAAAAGIQVKGAWIRTPPPGAPTAAGYATITNHAISSDRLMGGYSGAAASVTLHQMTTTAGVMRMRPVPGGLAIGASATVSLAPGGYHLMITGLKAPLKPGQHVKIVLQFQRGGNVTTDFVVGAGPGGGMRM
jgi:hypothetical protein